MFRGDISPGQHLLAKTVTNTKKEEVEMIIRGFYQVLIMVRGWCRLTSEKASRFQNTGRGGSSQREGRSSDYQPQVFQETCWALCDNLAFTSNTILARTCWTLLCTGRQVKPRSSRVKTIDHWQSSADSVTQQPAARINWLKGQTRCS